MSCPTCAAIAALLRGTGLTSDARSYSIGYSDEVRFLDKAAGKTGGKRAKGVSTGVRKASKYGKKLSKALKEVNKKARKKNGGLKKGWDQRRIMSTAQRLAKRRP